MGFFDKIKSMWAKKVQDSPETHSDTTLTGIPNPDEFYFQNGSDSNNVLKEFIDAVTDNGCRQELYNTYQEIEEGTPEINAGLDMYADYATQGGTVGGTRTLKIRSKKGRFDPQLSNIDKYIQLSRSSWSIVRGMCQYGDEFREVVYAPTGISKLKALPRASMYRVVNEYGTLQSFYQKLSNNSKIEFEPWQIAHFRLVVDESEQYGRSILWSIRREARELMLIRSGLTIARLSRAHRRIVHNIDVGNANSEKEVNAILNKARNRNRRQKMIDPNTGKMLIRANPLRSEEDIYVPVRKDSPARVHYLTGDTSIATLADVEFKREGIIAALKFSKAWLGLTGPNVRAVVGEQGLNFMRTVRRVRRDFVDTAIPIFQMGLMLQGIPWPVVFDAEIDISFPMMSHADDKLQIEVDILRLKAAELFLDMRLMSRLDILVIIFNKSVQDAQQLLKFADKETSDVLPTKKSRMQMRIVPTRKESEHSNEPSIPYTEWEGVRDRIFEVAENDENLKRSIETMQLLMKEIQNSTEFR